MTTGPGGPVAPPVRATAAPSVSPVVRAGRAVGILLLLVGAAILLAQRAGAVGPGTGWTVAGVMTGIAGLILIVTARLVIAMTRPAA